MIEWDDYVSDYIIINISHILTRLVSKRGPSNSMNIDKWSPPSVREIADKEQFNSTTYQSEIPSEVRLNMKEPVVLGVDEAGRGPVVGPMVYGVAYCLQSYHNELKSKYHFADSKTLKDDKRQELFEMIDTESHELYANVGWATCTMTAKDISSGMLRGGAGAYNLNEQAHDTTIALITGIISSGVNVREIFVDTVGPPQVYQNKLQRLFPQTKMVVTKKADSIYPVVSTASVVAKVTRDLNLQYFCKHVLKQEIGSGYPSDPNTSLWLKLNVDPVFGWHFGLVRFSWQTAKDALEKCGGVKVVYEHDVVEKGYERQVEDGMDQRFYVDPVVL